MKKILITLSILLLAGCSSYNLEQNFNYDQTTTQNITTTTSTKKMTTTTKKKTTKKTYKVNGEEYLNYIESVMNTIIQEEPLLQTFKRHELMPYVKIYLYPSKCIEENEFNVMAERISKKIFNEFKKNNYKKVKFYQASYEIINVYFENCGGGLYGNQWQNDEFTQYYMFELKDYKTYEDYLNSF